MAVRTQGNVVPYVISLVIFVFLFFISFVLMIVFMTKIQAAEILAKESRQELQKVIKQDERKLPEVLEMKIKQDTSKISIVGQLLAENRNLKQLINASPRSNVEAIKTEMQSLDVALGQTLISEIRRLRAENNASVNLVEQYKADMDTYAKSLSEIETQKMNQDQEYEKTVSQLKATLTSLQKDFDQFRGQTDTQRQALETQFEQVRANTQRQVNDLRSLAEQKDRQIAAQTKRLDELTGELVGTTKGGGPDLTRESDGMVTSILAEDSLVYIDRGRADQIMLGMTFEVFNKDAGVVVDELGELRGKATVEVIRMSERSSLTRIVRLERDANVNEDDLIANVVYDPNISYRFHVFGDFDIDDTGQVTATDRRRVETMVNQWGGQLTPRLSYNTDFLVLGQEPDSPQQLPPGEFDPVKIQRHAAQKLKFEKYQNLIAEAKALSIPILNQNRFLALVGYYQR